MIKRTFTEPIEHVEPYVAGKLILDIPSDIRVLLKPSLGGTFSAAVIQSFVNARNFSGIMCWMCMDSQGQLFLALEPKSNFTYPGDNPDLVEKLAPEATNLLISNSLFNIDFDALPQTETAFDDFIRTHHSPTPLNPNSTRGKQKVVEMSNSFRTHPDISPVCLYSHAYFDDDNDNPMGVRSFFKDFLAQRGTTYVRYYFGYDSLTPWRSKIRIMLAAVDSSGRNLNTSGVYLLENSWPPPPWN
jgi:hypothetical protein